MIGLYATVSATPPQIPCAACTNDPVEPVWNEGGTATRIKSPAQHMHFTAGAPLRILADALDANAWVCPPGHPPYVCPGTEERFFVDGVLVGTVPPSTDDFNLWELRLPNGLPEGDHVLTVKYVPYNQSTGGGGTPINGAVPVTIHIDPAPSHGGTINLTQNIVLTGATDLNWTDKTVIGNGFKVTAAAGYSGRIIIQGSYVRGLGTFSTNGIDVTTSGAVSIQGSIFEATGGIRVATQGSSPVTVKDNELRANNMLTLVANDPAVPVMLELSGGSGAKVVQGNRLGVGILRINGGNNWQIGGLGAGEGNILIGARCVLHLVNSSHDNIQGNYLHHDYNGGFSQGYNLWSENSSNELAEHNVIRQGSWPIQTFGGEFRYNLVIDSGHNFWRSANDNTLIHHNVFAHANGVNSGFEGGIMAYSGESGLAIYNNTFDGGGSIGNINAPAVRIGSGSLFQSIRNNLFTSFVNVSGTFHGAFISTDDGSVTSPRVSSADYNAWFNPLASSTQRYFTGMVAGTTGAHDVQANPLLSGAAEIPYRISEGCIWTGACTTAQVLAHYRDIYRPGAGSPLINAADPIDGAGTAIGAIGADDSNPLDLFGRVLPLTGSGPDVTPPTGSIAINDNAAVTKTTPVTLTLSAFDASGVTQMRLSNDGITFTAPEAYATTRAWTLTSGDGSKTVAVQFQDSVGNWSASFTDTITLDTTVVTDPPPPTGGLVAAYGFEEGGTSTTTADSSGNNLTGAIANASFVTGKFGKALNFAGVDGSWVTIPDAPLLDLHNGMTISAWVKPSTTLGPWPTVVMKERTDIVELTYALYANADAPGTQPNINYTSSGSEVNLNAGSTVPPNTWTYLTGTFDGARLRLYVNGTEVGSKDTSAPIDATTGVLRIGADHVWPGEAFPGAIDEVRIYNRALSPAEIQTDMNTPVVTGADQDSTPPTIAFNGPTGLAPVSGNVPLTASASDNVGVTGVQFYVDGNPVGPAVTTVPYAMFWNSALAGDGAHTLTATARDAAGNSTTSGPVVISSANAGVQIYPLKLASGQRYIVDHQNAPFFIHGEAAWSLIANLTTEEAETYLEDRRQKGVNAVMVNLLEHQYAAHAPRNVYNDAPFTTAGDFSTPNPAYFAHADLILQKAAQKGIVVFLTPAYLGFNGGSEGWYQEMSTSGVTKLTSYGQFLGNRYKDYPNIVWMHGGDYNPPNHALVNAVVNGIKAMDPNHLHTAHCNQGTAPATEWGSAGWLDVDNVYTYPVNNNAVPVYQKAQTEYARSDWRPFFLAESTYEGEYSAPAKLIRQQAYEALLSGGMGEFFGNRPIWLFDAGWQGALGSRGSIDMLTLRLLFGARHWEALVPDTAHTFVTAGFKNDGTTRSVAARASDGSWGVTYLPTARTITVNLSGFSGNVRARWYDPTTGALTNVTGSPFANTGSRNFTTPGSNATGTADWVLVFDVP